MAMLITPRSRARSPAAGRTWVMRAWSTPRYQPYPIPRIAAATMVMVKPLRSAGVNARTRAAIAITKVEITTNRLRLPDRSEM